MRLNIIFVIQKWFVFGVLLLVAWFSNTQTNAVEFLNDSAATSSTPITTFKLPPLWSAASQAVGASLGVGNVKTNRTQSLARVLEPLRTR